MPHFLLVLLLSTCAVKNSEQADCPFETYETSLLVAKAEIETNDIYEVYAPLFARNGYSGNGYCWQGHIIQILEKLKPELLSRVDFDPEAGGFYAYLENETDRTEFLETLCPIFSDLSLLEEYVQSADRSRVDY